MKLKGETLLNLGLTAVLAFSVAYLISSLALLKTKPCVKPFGAKEQTPQGEFYRKWKLPYSLEKEGFFLSKGGERREKETETQEGTVVQSIGEYTLKGTVVSLKGRGLAILKSKEGKSLVVEEGGELEGYRLKKVLPEKALFEREGKEFVLELKGKEELKGKGEFSTKEDHRYTVNRKEVVQEISSGEFLKYINIVPVKDPQGLRVNYVNPRSFIYKLGIRPGDIILSINDIRIKTPEDSFAAFERLKNSDTITITVLRRGREVKLHYELQ